MQIKQLKLSPTKKKVVYRVTCQGNIQEHEVQPKKSTKKESLRTKKQDKCKVQLGQMNSIQISQNSRFKTILEKSALVTIPTLQAIGSEGQRKLKCNCKKSKCLKLYCDCFANKTVCGKQCECLNCANLEQNSKRLQIVEEIIPKRVEVKGCKCSKSSCQKKYCDCFNKGVPCGQHCSCVNCLNGEVREQHQSP